MLLIWDMNRVILNLTILKMFELFVDDILETSKMCNEVSEAILLLILTIMNCSFAPATDSPWLSPAPSTKPKRGPHPRPAGRLWLGSHPVAPLLRKPPACEDHQPTG